MDRAFDYKRLRATDPIERTHRKQVTPTRKTLLDRLSAARRDLLEVIEWKQDRHFPWNLESYFLSVCNRYEKALLACRHAGISIGS